MDMCKQLGVPLTPGKTVGPCTTIQFLGITLDTVSMEARLPDDKLDKGRLLIRWRKTTFAFSIGDHYNVSFISY